VDIQTVRINNLRATIAGKSDNAADFARKFNLDASYISQVLNGHRGFGEKAARKFEKQAKLRPGELDETKSGGPIQEVGAIMSDLGADDQRRVLDAARAFHALAKQKDR